ncbi:MAG: hypothetical protein ACOVLE_06530 [Pirellula staleyi]
MNLFGHKTIVWLLLGTYSILIFVNQALHLVPGLDCGSSHCRIHQVVEADVESMDAFPSGVCQHRHHSGCHRNQFGQNIANKQPSEFAAADGICLIDKLLAMLCGALYVGSHHERQEASCLHVFLNGAVDEPSSVVYFRSRAPPAIA